MRYLIIKVSGTQGFGWEGGAVMAVNVTVRLKGWFLNNAV
jgi:hypothetical protein